jgi:hypothetical protein
MGTEVEHTARPYLAGVRFAGFGAFYGMERNPAAPRRRCGAEGRALRANRRRGKNHEFRDVKQPSPGG